MAHLFQGPQPHSASQCLIHRHAWTSNSPGTSNSRPVWPALFCSLPILANPAGFRKACKQQKQVPCSRHGLDLNEWTVGKAQAFCTVPTPLHCVKVWSEILESIARPLHLFHSCTDAPTCSIVSAPRIYHLDWSKSTQPSHIDPIM